MYLEADKNQTRHRLTYLEVSKLEQAYGSSLQGQSTTPKVYGTFQPLKTNN